MEYSDQEQLDAIKKWWHDNGTAVVVGVALGVSVLFGWNFYQNYQHTQRITASAIYERVRLHLQQQQPDEARAALHLLLSDYSNSTYAMLGALSVAQQDVKDGELDTAHARLQWVIDQGDMPELTHIARLRKARLHLNQNQVNEAEQLLAAVPADNTAFSGSYAEIRGDIAVAQQQPEVARTAYETALESEHLAGEHRQFIQMKQDNLGKPLAQQIVALSPTVDVTATPATAAAIGTPSPITLQPLDDTTQPLQIITEMATPTTPATP